MKSKTVLRDESDYVAQLESLRAEADKLESALRTAGKDVPARPSLAGKEGTAESFDVSEGVIRAGSQRPILIGGDTIAACELMQAHNARLRVQCSLSSIKPTLEPRRDSTEGFSAICSRSTGAVPPSQSQQPACADSVVPAKKLTLTQQVLANKGAASLAELNARRYAKK